MLINVLAIIKNKQDARKHWQFEITSTIYKTIVLCGENCSSDCKTSEGNALWFVRRDVDLHSDKITGKLGVYWSGQFLLLYRMFFGWSFHDNLYSFIASSFHNLVLSTGSWTAEYLLALSVFEILETFLAAIILNSSFNFSLAAKSNSSDEWDSSKPDRRRFLVLSQASSNLTGFRPYLLVHHLFFWQWSIHYTSAQTSL